MPTAKRTLSDSDWRTLAEACRKELEPDEARQIELDAWREALVAQVRLWDAYTNALRSEARACAKQVFERRKLRLVR